MLFEEEGFAVRCRFGNFFGAVRLEMGHAKTQHHE